MTEDPTPSIAAEAGRRVRLGLADLDTLVDAAKSDRDLGTLAEVLRITGRIKTEAGALDRDVSRAAAALMVKKHQLTEHGMLERSKQSVTHGYDSEALLSRVLDRVLVDGETGERLQLTAEEALNRAYDLLVAVAPFTASTGWRRTALDAAGVDYEYLHSTDGGEMRARAF